MRRRVNGLNEKSIPKCKAPRRGFGRFSPWQPLDAKEQRVAWPPLYLWRSLRSTAGALVLQSFSDGGTSLLSCRNENLSASASGPTPASIGC